MKQRLISCVEKETDLKQERHIQTRMSGVPVGGSTVGTFNLSDGSIPTAVMEDDHSTSRTTTNVISHQKLMTGPAMLVGVH